jgi:hypothetical protein
MSELSQSIIELKRMKELERQIADSDLMRIASEYLMDQVKKTRKWAVKPSKSVMEN